MKPVLFTIKWERGISFMANSNSRGKPLMFPKTAETQLSFFSCLMSVQTDLLVPWCDFMKANGWWYSMCSIFTPLKQLGLATA